jgi:hypothetical protein
MTGESGSVPRAGSDPWENLGKVSRANDDRVRVSYQEACRKGEVTLRPLNERAIDKLEAELAKGVLYDPNDRTVDLNDGSGAKLIGFKKQVYLKKSDGSIDLVSGYQFPPLPMASPRPSLGAPSPQDFKRIYDDFMDPASRQSRFQISVEPEDVEKFKKHVFEPPGMGGSRVTVYLLKGSPAYVCEWPADLPVAKGAWYRFAPPASSPR